MEGKWDEEPRMTPRFLIQANEWKRRPFTIMKNTGKQVGTNYKLILVNGKFVPLV